MTGCANWNQTWCAVTQLEVVNKIFRRYWFIKLSAILTLLRFWPFGMRVGCKLHTGTLEAFNQFLYIASVYVLFKCSLATRWAQGGIWDNSTNCQQYFEVRRSCYKWIYVLQTNTNCIDTKWNQTLKLTTELSPVILFAKMGSHSWRKLSFLGTKTVRHIVRIPVVPCKLSLLDNLATKYYPTLYTSIK